MPVLFRHVPLLVAAVAVALWITAVACAPASPGPGRGTPAELRKHTVSPEQASSSPSERESVAAQALDPTESPGRGSPTAQPWAALLPAGTPAAPGDVAARRETSGPTKAPAATKGTDCFGVDAIQKIRAEYAANHLRAKATYIGQRICLEGTVSGIYKGDRGGSVGVRVGEDVRFSLRGRDTDERQISESNWRAWILAVSVGDRVQGECRIQEFTPTREDPKRAPGIPVLTDCKRLVDGAFWTAPAPTPTPLPCVPVGLGEPSGTWLNIDCLNGKVTAGDMLYPHERPEYQSLLSGDSTVIAFYFRAPYEGGSDDSYGHHSAWKRWIEEPQDDRIRFVWEAPPEVASIIISEWQRGVAVELAMLVGDCCYYRMGFDLTQPGPPREWKAIRSAPVPTPTPTRRPTSTSTPAPTPAPTPETLPGDSPLVAAFLDVPTSHNGEDAVQFGLSFSEPVSTSYKVLRDVAIQAANGTVLESKRVDKRNDLWMVTVEPDGAEDMVITLTAQAGCDDAAAVCTGSGKALSNSPVTRIPHGE